MATRSIEFEVFGKVQGVFFRKFTAAKAEELKLAGWVFNHESGTVRGHGGSGGRDGIERGQTFRVPRTPRSSGVC